MLRYQRLDESYICGYQACSHITWHQGFFTQNLPQQTCNVAEGLSKQLKSNVDINNMHKNLNVAFLPRARHKASQAAVVEGVCSTF